MGAGVCSTSLISRVRVTCARQETAFECRFPRKSWNVSRVLERARISSPVPCVTCG